MTTIHDRFKLQAQLDQLVAQDGTGAPVRFLVDNSGRVTLDPTSSVGLASGAVVRMKPSQTVSSTSNLTTTAHQVAVAMDGMNTATFYFSGTHVGFNLTFEQSPNSTTGSDGTWFTTVGSNVSLLTGGATTTGVLTSNSSTAWEVTAPGAAWVRARVTAVTSGTLVGQVTATASPVETSPNIPTHAVTGSGTFAVTESGTWNVGATGVTQTTAGTTSRKVLSAATTNATSVVAAVATLYGFHLANTTASWKYFRVFNKASAPTVGTDSPAMVIPIPPNGVAQGHLSSQPSRFTTGLAYAITGASADLDATAVAAGDVVGFLLTS